MTDASEVEIAIAGSGPAGLAAALEASRLGRRVTIVAPTVDDKRSQDYPVWLSSAGVDLLEHLGAPLPTERAKSIEAVQLRSVDGAAQRVAGEAPGLGVITSRADIDATLRAVASDAGVDFRTQLVTGVESRESCARLAWDDGALLAEVVLIATGAGRDLADAATPAVEGAHQSTATANTGGSVDAPVTFVFASDHPGALGQFVRQDDRVAIVVQHAGEAGQREAYRAAVVAAGVEAGLVSEAPTQWREVGISPAGHAIEREGHVFKRGLTIGAAGGFVAAMSHEGLFPALKSGALAAQVAHEALEAELLQDVLATYDARWRLELADYLRVPNADLSMLLSLVFRNEQIARRLVHALMRGEAF